MPGGQGWRQAGELGLALVLSASIGTEREIRQKNAGLRTQALVGLGAACSCWPASTDSAMSW